MTHLHSQQILFFFLSLWCVHGTDLKLQLVFQQQANASKEE